MRKSFYVTLLVVLLIAVFWTGSRRLDATDLPAGHANHDSAAADSGQTADSAIAPDPDSLAPGSVKVGLEKQQLIGVRTGVVESGPMDKTLRLLGTVAPDEDRLFRVTAAVDGVILKVYPSTTGSLVEKGQQLATYYSPEIYTAEQSFIVAASTERYRKYQYQFLQVQVTESNLRFLGMTASQIAEIRKTGEIAEDIVLQAPERGFVLARAVYPELRFLKGEELYRIANLDRVWIYVDVYESEARYVKPHATAKVSHPQLGKEFQAAVSDVLPLFDPATRTLKVRLEVDNPEFMLKPDMFVDVELQVSFPPAVSVPDDAVLDSGLRKTVFVDLGDGYFEPREVQTGWHFDHRIEITKGLEAGERIAVSGNFLIDSESRLDLTAWGIQTGMSRDPVCDLDVSQRKAAREGRTAVYKDRTFYFSSADCKARFEKEPEKYVQD